MMGGGVRCVAGGGVTREGSGDRGTPLAHHLSRKPLSTWTITTDPGRPASSLRGLRRAQGRRGGRARASEFDITYCKQTSL